MYVRELHIRSPNASGILAEFAAAGSCAGSNRDFGTEQRPLMWCEPSGAFGRSQAQRLLACRSYMGATQLHNNRHFHARRTR